MKYYTIFSKTGVYLGYTESKELLNIFLEQRGEANYNITKLDTNKHDKSLMDSVISSYDEMGMLNGITLFPSEEEYFNAGLGQMFIDIRSQLGWMCKLIPYFNFSKEESEKVYKCLAIILNINNRADGYINGYYEEDVEIEPDDDFDIADFVKLDIMLKQIIGDLN